MEYILENSLVGITFDSVLNALTSLRRQTRGHEAIKSIIRDSLFQIVFSNKKTNERSSGKPGRIDKVEKVLKNNEQVLSIIYKSVYLDDAEIKALVKINITLGDNQSEFIWKIEVTNNSHDFIATEVLFPYIQGIYLGDTWEDDIIVFPHHAGEKTIAPAINYRTDRYQNYFRAETQIKDDRWYREINYCGLASMMWLSYYDNHTGIYFGSHDENFLVTGLLVETGGTNSLWMGFSFRKHKIISTEETWISSDYVIAYNDQDWHWGAKRYRKWFTSVIKVTSYSGDLNNEFTLNQCYQFKRQGQIYNRYDDIPQIYNRGRKMFKAKHLFLASWNRSGFDRDYPEYQPDLELGTPLDLATSCDYVNSHDGFVTFYINARIFHLESDFHSSLGQEWGIKKPDKSLYLEQYGPEHFSVNCPSHESWQNTILGFAEWMMRAYGAKGIYLDQLGSAEPFACYDESHSHHDIGLFNQGYVEVLQQLLKRIKILNPGGFIMIENCGDIYSNYVWGNLTWNGDDYDEFYEMYKYTFPEFAQVHMVNPLDGLPEQERWEKFIRKFIRAFLLGAIFWLGIDKFEDQDDQYYKYMQKAVRLRNEITPYYINGCYVDNEDVVGKTEGIEAAHWIQKDGSHLFVLGNSQNLKQAKVIVKLPGFDLSSIMHGDIDQNIELLQIKKMDDDTFEIVLPPSEISYFILIGNQPK